MKSKKKNLVQRIVSRILHQLARTLPGRLTLRPTLHRWRGVKIGPEVAIGDDVYLENEHPEAVEICAGAHIAMRCTIIAHTRGTGKVIIGKNSFIGACSTIVCPVGREIIIGEGAVIGAGSIITQSVEPLLFCGPPKPVPYARATVPLSKSTHAAFIRGLRPISTSSQPNLSK